jgi:Cof subfamily protein (haloacid dehalogenase superfamily)
MSRTPTIRAIATDLDGTLLNEQHALTARTEAALREALARGIHVILATGKSRFSALGLISRLGLRSPGVYNQGTTIYGGDGVLLGQFVLDPRAAAEVIRQGIASGLVAMLASGSRTYAQAFDAHIERLSAYGEHTAIVPSLLDLPGILPVNKVFFTADDPDRLKAFRNRVAPDMAGRATLVQAVREVLEVIPPGASKGEGVRIALEHLGISPAETLAAGDGENDIEMVQLAGIGVAVANAYHRLRDVADHVVASNDADGVGEAIERFVLGGG